MKNHFFAFVFFIGWVFVPIFAHATNGVGLFLRPGSGSFFVGSTFDVSIVLDTKDRAINTVEVELLFPQDLLQLASPSTGSSIVQIWASPPIFSNREGRIYFVGGIPSPGIETSQGVVLTLTFRAIAPGAAKIEFGPRTSVILNDPLGTDILTQSPPAFFKLSVPPPQGPVIYSPTHSDQEVWHRDPNPIFVWQGGSFARGFSYSIDQDPSGVSDTVSEGKNSTAAFENLNSGIWYFHLREEAGGVWGGASHYAVKIDKDPPASFKINVFPGLRTSNRDSIFRFFSTDSFSGFDHFELKIISLSSGGADALFFEATSPYQASNLKSGRNQIIVRALDRAGNSTDSSVVVTVITPLTRFFDLEGINLGFIFLRWSSVISWLFFVLLLLVLVLIALLKKHKGHLADIFWKDVEKILRFVKKNRHKSLHIAIFLQILFFVGFNDYVLAKEILSPIIGVAPFEYYPLDETLYLEGKAEPNSSVEILFERLEGGASPIRVGVQSNSAGDWFFSQKLELASGEWYARARISSDTLSDWSNPRAIRSIISGFIIGGLKIKYIPMAIILFMLLASSAGLFIYLLFRVHAVNKAQIEQQIKLKTEILEQKLKEKEKNEADMIIERNFEDLKRKFIEELEHLDAKARNSGQLSLNEEQHRSDILKKLREAEETIEQKVKNLS